MWSCSPSPPFSSPPRALNVRDNMVGFNDEQRGMSIWHNTQRQTMRVVRLCKKENKETRAMDRRCINAHWLNTSERWALEVTQRDEENRAHAETHKQAERTQGNMSVVQQVCDAQHTLKLKSWEQKHPWALWSNAACSPPSNTCAEEGWWWRRYMRWESSAQLQLAQKQGAGKRCYCTSQWHDLRERYCCWWWRQWCRVCEGVRMPVVAIPARQ